MSQLRVLILEPSARSNQAARCRPPPPPQTPSLIPPLLQALTGEAPPPSEGSHDDGNATKRKSFAGYTTHPPLRIKTRYFDRKVGLWCDEVPLPRLPPRRPSGDSRRVGVEDEDDPAHHDGDVSAGSPGEATTQTWLTQFLGPEPEAVEVRAVIGAIVLAIPVRDSLEANPFRSSLSAHAPPLGELGENSEIGRQRRPSQWRLREEYLDIVEAVNTLRETIEDEKARHADHECAGGDVAAVILLQGEVPGTESRTRRSLRGKRAGKAPGHDEDGDDRDRDHEADADSAQNLVEAVEEQLLTDRAVLGLDVIAWDGVIPPSPTALTAIIPPTLGGDDPNRVEGGGGGGGGGGAGGRNPPAGGEEEEEEASAATQGRNIHGEKTGLPRLHEVLSNRDWTALPPPPSPHHHQKAQNMVEDPDTDLDFLPSDDDPLDFDLSAGLLNMNTAYSARGEDEEEEEEEEDEAIKVEQLQGLLQQAMVIREVGKEMSRAERGRYARRMVGGLVRDL